MSSTATALLVLAAGFQSASALNASWGGRPFSQASWPWLDTSFNAATINVFKGSDACAANTSLCVPQNYCNTGPLVNCNLKQGAPSLFSCLGVDKTWRTHPEKWRDGNVNNGVVQCGRDWSGYSCCRDGLTPFQASKDSVTVKIQVNPGPFGVSLANYKAAQAHLDAPQALVPCKFPPRCFPNPNPGSPCPGADTAPAPPAGVKIDGIVITYNNASAAPAANANAPPPPGLCCQSANTTCPPYPAPDFATTYLPAVGYQVYMCFAKSSIYLRGWRKANGNPAKNKQCWLATSGNYTWVSSTTTDNGDGTSSTAYAPAAPLWATFHLEPVAPQAVYYTRVFMLDASGRKIGLGDSNVTQGYFYVDRYDPLEDGQIHKGAAIMSSFSAVLLGLIVFREGHKSRRAAKANAGPMETDVKG